MRKTTDHSKLTAEQRLSSRFSAVFERKRTYHCARSLPDWQSFPPEETVIVSIPESEEIISNPKLQKGFKQLGKNKFRFTTPKQGLSIQVGGKTVKLKPKKTYKVFVVKR